MRFYFSLLCAFTAAAVLVGLGEVRAHDLTDTVVKVRAIDADGEVSFGSAVAIGPEKLATACHTTREAVRIEVSHGGKQWLAQTQVGSVVHDLCLLRVSGLHLRPVQMRNANDLVVGEQVVAAGFLAGEEKLILGAGKVEGLYRHDGGPVIRTSAPFDFGSSGGGLFDQAGNLIGVLAFKSRSGENLRFALPVAWLAPESIVASSFGPVGPGSTLLAFWERPKSEQPAFLGVAVQEAKKR